MSKIKKYTDLLNKEFFSKIDKADLESEDTMLLMEQILISSFVSIYGSSFVSEVDCVEDEGFAYVPAIIKTKSNKKYLALLSICVQDSGEHYDTVFFTNKGAVYQNELKNKGIEGVIPYEYKPLVEIIGDIHESSYFID